MFTKENLLLVWNWILRNSVLTLVIFVGLYLLAFENSFIVTLIKAVVTFAIAILLAGIGLYCYTKIKFMASFIYGTNNVTDKAMEYNFTGRIISSMLIASAIVVTGVIIAYSVIENAKTFTKGEIEFMQDNKIDTNAVKFLE